MDFTLFTQVQLISSKMDGYKPFKRDRRGKKGGGVALPAKVKS